MFRRMVLGTVAVLASAAIVHADAKDDVKAAGKALSDKGNYTFAITTAMGGAQAGGGGGGGGRGGFGGGPVNGKVDSGMTWITTMGRGGAVEVIFKGDAMVIKTADAWQTAAEMAAAGGGGGGGRRGGGGAARYAMYKDPVANALANVDKIANLAKADDAIAGDISGDAAAPLFAFGGGRGGRGGGGGGGGGAAGGGAPPAVTNAKAAFKFWIKDGMLAKVEMHTTGSMDRGGNPVDIDRTTTTEFTDIGSTKLDVPADAKAKLDAPAAPAAPATN